MDASGLPALDAGSLLADLASACDGAKSRDGIGFSRADQTEGRRLAALSSAGLPWNPQDTSSARSLVGRYAHQAARIRAAGDQRLERRIEALLKAGRFSFPEPDPSAPQFPNMALLSASGVVVHLWTPAWTPAHAKLIEGIKSLRAIRHGERSTRIRFEKDAEITVAGERRKAARWEVDFNVSALGPLLVLCEEHGLAVDPSVYSGPDPEEDEARKASRAAFLRHGTKDGRKGEWAVFDLASAHPPFASMIKGAFWGQWYCDRLDDWNWYVALDEETAGDLREIASTFGFRSTPSLVARWSDLAEADREAFG
jgi:hypothetical protein